MAKVFLDTNYFIDAIVRKPEKQILDQLLDNIILISTLSLHIYCYTYKIKIPDKRVIAQRSLFQLVDFSVDIVKKALLGPTTDFEDNVQLHSAATDDCDYFLTEDKKLLKMKFFGRPQITTSLTPQG